jgi:hypothetical protein
MFCLLLKSPRKYIFISAVIALQLLVQCNQALAGAKQPPAPSPTPSQSGSEIVYQDETLMMGYITSGDTVDRTGYDQCTATLGRYVDVESDNSANHNPVFQVDVNTTSISFSHNRWVRDPVVAFICTNAQPTSKQIVTGYSASGTNIGAGLSCVTTIGNFKKFRAGGGGRGTLSCTYDSATGVVTARDTGAGEVTDCGYVCVDDQVSANTAGSSRLLVRHYEATNGATDNIGASLAVAYGTNYFFSKCSGTGIVYGNYNETTGTVTQGQSTPCTSSSYSYISAFALQCSDGVDNDGDGLTDIEDPGCSTPDDDDESDGTSQCQDGIDNDGDGATDIADFSCSSPQDNDETNPKAQCQDGSDNDSDGAIDMNDFSCASNQDNDESDPQSECQDGTDNDGDGVIDLADPGCGDNPQNDDESAGTTQCQDNIDNDGDGAADLQDYSCLGDNTKDDEANPLSECQDGVDNDGDSLIDGADPACTTPQHNNEGSATTQCQDGVDNDSDGATDLADYSCQGLPTNDNEAIPLAECQDTVDNDLDGLTDLADPGCSSSQDNFEGDGTSQCQDGIDNDGDGAIDNNDFSCQGDNTKNDEANPKSQCQDGVDNDGDIVIDMQDPGCSSPQDNNEGDGTTACQDGLDNDGDGAIDLADFSCGGDPINRDEANPKSQCQNTIDDDSDGLTDLNDPGCANNQDNDESDGTSQCQNTVDDDTDGLVDMADPGCSTPQDNDESDGTSQCQNTVDDDTDGLVDMADPGCATPQDNDESDGTSQCQNTVDDDTDGLIDMADPGCATPQDNDESDGTSQCQNTVDDDTDGLVDMADPGCSTPQDNDESDGTSQCQNTVDDDADGLIDMADPGCTTPQDNDESGGTSQCQNTIDDDVDGLTDMADPGCSTPQDNDESDEPTLLSLGLECVTKNADSTKTAYFSYNNTASADVTVVNNAGAGTVNAFITDDANITTPPTTFKPGLATGTVAVTFNAPSLTWVVRAAGSAQSQATASDTTPECGAVVPFAECRGFQNGVMTVRLGYDNPNGFAQHFDIGSNNGFTPGAIDRGQPTQFFSGLNSSAIEVGIEDIDTGVTWNINNESIRLDSTLPACAGECTEVSSGSIQEELDQVAVELSALVVRAAEALKASKVRRKRDKVDFRRAKKKAEGYIASAKALTIQIPEVTKTCPDAPQLCVTVDRGPIITQLSSLYAVQRNSVRRTIARAYWRNTGSTGLKARKKLVRAAVTLEQQGNAALAELPRFAEDCE